MCAWFACEQALIDYQPMAKNPRSIDGIILTKFDTVDDKVRSFRGGQSSIECCQVQSRENGGARSFFVEAQHLFACALLGMCTVLQVGAALSMVYITGQPIIFVGTGQTYSDLRNLNVKLVTRALLK